DVQRQQSAKVDDLRIKTVFLRLLSGLEAGMHHRAVTQDGELRPGAYNLSLAKRHRVIAVGYLALGGTIDPFGFHKDHRVFAANRGEQEPLGVVWRRRNDHL